jgi:phage-related protein
MPDDRKKLVVRFYQTGPTGRVPVREWLKALAPDDRRIIGEDIKTVEYGWPIGMPTCRALGAGLWEVRSRLSDGRSARVFFCMADDHMVLLHGFIKKTQRTPTADLTLARQRMKDVRS